MSKQKLPKGLTHEKIKAIIDHYENQSDEEAEAEIEAAFSDPRFCWIQVPVEMVEEVQRLIAEKEKTAAPPPMPASKRVAEPKAKYGGKR